LPNADGTFKKIPQIGNVIIEDDVDVGSCTTIEQTMDRLLLEKGKLDNQIQVAHNVEIVKIPLSLLKQESLVQPRLVKIA
jgi:UDP-3-O-[3-hydroxymyristoyl] glucosamine N-acyltransferase